MELQTSNLLLSQLEENKWYYFESDMSNEITGLMLSEQKVFITFIGRDFEKPFTFWFDYSQDGFNEMWQYEFREDYHRPIEKEKDTLFGMNELAVIPYIMLNDLHYSCRHMGVVKDAK